MNAIYIQASVFVNQELNLGAVIPAKTVFTA